MPQRMKVRFTVQAETDIIDSYLYGFENFGRGQADRYEAGLRRAIDIIAANPQIAAERREYDPPVRIHHHAKHYIVYLIGEAHIVVVRVLRDEVDLTRHLGTEA